jgi:uncharacterized OsmC-like protein
MKISASVKNTASNHTATVKTNESETSISIPAKTTGRGSGINGGELLFLSLGSCYCNDIFREAKEMGIEVNTVEVNVEGEFGGKGEPTTLINYDVKISAEGSEAQITKLLRHTDSVAEIQNTLRIGIPVNLRHIEILK